MLQRGCYPAAVTPFELNGKVDYASLAKLLAWFENGGCKGAVLGGTNGEGPSLSAPEKRDLLREAMPLRGKLDLILGIATPSLDEAVWLCKQAGMDGAVAALVMPPSYFREASEDGIEAWFLHLLDRSGVPIIVYNFPQRTGITIPAAMLERLSAHGKFAGVKDSSGDRSNLAAYAQAVLPRNRALYVGNETLLVEALRAGWTGTISGAANVLPDWMSTIVAEFDSDRESAETKHTLVEPVLQTIRQASQPATNKALLARAGIIEHPDVRLPLMSAQGDEVDKVAIAIGDATGHWF